MFYEARAFNADISRWDVSSVIDMRHMFQNAYAFNRDISRWTTSGSACCSYRGYADYSPWYAMFDSATAFTARYTSLPMGDNSCSDCHLRWNPSMLTRKDDACDASTPPDNGGVGNCTDTLWSGGSAVLSLVDISATISRDINSGEPRRRATARSSSRPTMRTAWGCSTRATIASRSWTSAPPSLLTGNSGEPRRLH